MSELESKLAEIMNEIAEVEGIIAFKEGNLLSGQTIDESLDKSNIAKVTQEILQGLQKFGNIIEKGKIQDITLSLDDGYAVVVFGKDNNIVAFVGNDGKAQLALLARTLKNLL